jgi:hypothetical protein
MPAADDLFRPTATPVRAPEEEKPASQPPDHSEARSPGGETAPSEDPGRGGGGSANGDGARDSRQPSGRVRHDEKMTVYVTSDELLDLEHARLALRRTSGLAVDRGRLVRAAVAIALADLDAHGEDSQLVQRLMQS